MEKAKDPTLVNLVFGGDKHGNAVSAGNKRVQMRPEAVKTQVCEEPSSKCSECNTKASCWRGSMDVSALSKKGNSMIDNTRLGSLKLDVSDSATANYYAAEMWASCGSGNGKWSLIIWRDTIVNGVIKLFVDGSQQKDKITYAKPGQKSSGWTRNTKGRKMSRNAAAKVDLEIAVVKNTRLRVLFERLTAGQVASAQVKVKASTVDEYVDECMGVTNCLVDLGDGSDSAFRFRNSNKIQLNCLKATTDWQRDKVSGHCKVWEKCVSNSGIAPKLKALLGAALTPRGSLAEGKVNMQEFNDAEGCVDPNVEDAESWSCECVDEMTESCNELRQGVPLETCFHSIMCGNTNVCESWKGDHCGEFLLAKASQNKSAALTRRGAKTGPDASILISHRTKVEQNVGDSLDSSLTGKCAL